MDLIKNSTQMILVGFLFAGALCGIEYLSREYKTHCERIMSDTTYKNMVLEERERRSIEAHKQIVKFSDDFANKYRIPFLEDLLK